MKKSTTNKTGPLIRLKKRLPDSLHKQWLSGNLFFCFLPVTIFFFTATFNNTDGIALKYDAHRTSVTPA